jgi:Flp pilus assembly pilin Flp
LRSSLLEFFLPLLRGFDSLKSSPRHTPKEIALTTVSELWADDQGQDIAEYAVMLAAILVIVIGTIRLVGSNANNAFSTVASSLQ